MKNFIKLIVIKLSLFMFFSAHAQEHIVWDNNSKVPLDSIWGDYPRACVIDDSIFAITYTSNGFRNLFVLFDNDLREIRRNFIVGSFFFTDITGKNTKVNCINPVIKKINNGRILFLCNLRPEKSGIFPWSIASCYSDDNGITWSKLKILYKASIYSQDGCWEPDCIILPNGIIKLYFSNEFPFKESDEQEIDCMCSFDNAETWSEPTVISYSKGKRDGMPVPVYYNNKIYVSIEDNTNGPHQPSIIISSADCSTDEIVRERSQNRIPILSSHLDSTTYAGAPYIDINNEGLFILSFQTNKLRDVSYEKTDMAVAFGKINGRIFELTYPFQTPKEKYARWGSVKFINNETVIALTTSNVNGRPLVYMMRGTIK